MGTLWRETPKCCLEVNVNPKGAVVGVDVGVELKVSRCVDRDP